MPLDKSPSGLHGIAHQDRKDLVGLDGVIQRDLEHGPRFGIHRGVPKLFRVHFPQTFVALNGIFLADEDKAWELAQRIQSGTVWVNETQHLSPMAAFGGVKQSGVGVEGGLEGLLEYTNAQTLVRRKKPAFAQ